MFLFSKIYYCIVQFISHLSSTNLVSSHLSNQSLSLLSPLSPSSLPPLLCPYYFVSSPPSSLPHPLSPLLSPPSSLSPLLSSQASLTTALRNSEQHEAEHKTLWHQLQQSMKDQERLEKAVKEARQQGRGGGGRDGDSLRCVEL